MAGLRGYGSVTLQSMDKVLQGRQQATHNHSAGHLLPSPHRRSSDVSFGESMATASVTSAGTQSAADDDGSLPHTGKFTDIRLTADEEEDEEEDEDEDDALSDLDAEGESRGGEPDAFAEKDPVPLQSPGHGGNSVATGVADEQSMGASTIETMHPSQLSPNAPAPSYIDKPAMSGDAFEAHLHSALSMTPHGNLSSSPQGPTHVAGDIDVGLSSIDDAGSFSLVGAQHQLEGSQTVSDIMGSSSGGVAGGNPHHHALKHADTAAVRVKEIKDRIDARAPSAALEAFQVE